MPRAPLRLLVLAAAAPLTAQQAPSPAADAAVLAHYQLGGKQAVIARDDVAQLLSRRFGRTDQGKEAVDFLIGLELIRSAATAQSLMPNAADTRAWIAELERKLNASGASLASLMAQKGMSLPDFEQYAQLQLAQERLVRRALGLEADAAVTAEMLHLWLDEARGKNRVVTDAEKLPGGARAIVGERTITDLDVGRALLRSTELEQRQRYIRQVVLERCLQAEADAHGIEITPQEMAREVEARRREAETNPAYQKVPFDQLLEAQGTTVEELARSPVLRAQIQERKLVDELLPESELTRRLEQERAAVLRRHGARRRLQILLVRSEAGEAGAEAAQQRVAQVRERIVREMPFSEAARSYSDDPFTKIAGGDAGWHNREGSRLPAAVIEAGFAADVGALSEPIRVEEGWYLVQVAAVEPEPGDETLALRLRQELAQELRERLLRDAQIRFSETP